MSISVFFNVCRYYTDLSVRYITFRCHSFRYITPIDNTCRALRCNVHRCLYHSYIMPVDIILVSLRYSVGDFLSDKLPINGLSLIYIVRRCLYLRYKLRSVSLTLRNSICSYNNCCSLSQIVSLGVFLSKITPTYNTSLSQICHL